MRNVLFLSTGLIHSFLGEKSIYVPTSSAIKSIDRLGVMKKNVVCSTGKLATPSILMKRTRRDMSVGDTYMQQQASRISPLPRNQRFPFSLDCETIFYRGALALRIYYICNGLRKLRQSANISHDLHLHDSPFYARSFKPSRHVNHNREPRLLCIGIPSSLSHNQLGNVRNRTFGSAQSTCDRILPNEISPCFFFDNVDIISLVYNTYMSALCVYVFLLIAN